MCKELTLEELKGTNGCGSSHWLLQVFRIPKWLSKGLFRCCNRHDLRYGNLEDKAFADDELYDCWMYVCMHSGWFKRLWMYPVIEAGYAAVTSKASELAYNKCIKDKE